MEWYGMIMNYIVSLIFFASFYIIISSSLFSKRRMALKSKSWFSVELVNKQNLYYNCTSEVRILCSRQKKYELLENMKNPSYIGQNKYENLEEPSRTSHTRYSYFFNTFVKSCQIFILIQSLFYNWPDLHTFSVSLPDYHTFSILSKFG